MFGRVWKTVSDQIITSGSTVFIELFSVSPLNKGVSLFWSCHELSTSQSEIKVNIHFAGGTMADSNSRLN